MPFSIGNKLWNSLTKHIFMLLPLRTLRLSMLDWRLRRSWETYSRSAGSVSIVRHSRYGWRRANHAQLLACPGNRRNLYYAPQRPGPLNALFVFNRGFRFIGIRLSREPPTPPAKLIQWASSRQTRSRCRSHSYRYSYSYSYSYIFRLMKMTQFAVAASMISLALLP